MRGLYVLRKENKTMKKRIGIILLTAIVAIFAFALTACGGLSGAEINKETYEKAAENFAKAIEENSFKIVVSTDSTYKYESTSVYTSKPDLFSIKYSKSINSYTAKISTKTTLIIEENKAYFKEESTSETIEFDGNSEDKKEITEYYIEKIGKTFYLIEKNLNNNWVAISKNTYAENYTMLDHMKSRINSTSGIANLSSYAFDDLSYASGRYNVKKTVTDEKNKASENKDTDTAKYTYTYYKQNMYFVFNNDGLYSGYVTDNDTANTKDSTDDYTVFTQTQTASAKNTNLKTISITYGDGDTVSIPSYEK